MAEHTVHSTHTFLFPFRISLVNSNNASDSNSKQKNKHSLEPILTGLTGTGFWKEVSRENTDESVRYNMRQYYFSYIHPLLGPRFQFSGEEKSIVQEFEANISKDSTYEIHASHVKSYVLNIDRIFLKIYNERVAILGFDLSNIFHPSPIEVLNINQFGRRLYPPFVEYKEEFESVGTHLTWPVDKEVAYGVMIRTGDMTIEEDFTNIRDLSGSLDILKVSRIISKILGMADWSGYQLRGLLDDRMFVHSWCGCDQIEDWDDWWYKYVFVDNADFKTVQNVDFQNRLLTEHSYTRWTDWRIWFGTARYSFVLRSDRYDSDEFIPILLKQFRTLYLQMVEIALVQRVYIIDFSSRIAEISGKLNDVMVVKEVRSIPAQIRELYSEYLYFINKIYFREVTAQEQGIELYDLIQSTWRIDAQIKDLGNEMRDLHQYAELLETENQNKQVQRLTMIGTALLLPSLIFGFFGMNTFDSKDLGTNATTVILVFSFVITSVVSLIFGSKQSWGHRLCIILGLAITHALLWGILLII